LRQFITGCSLNQEGKRFPFAIGWSTGGNNAGAIVSKAHGLNADKLPSTVDNANIYRLAQ
jgi:alkaline phosphatase